MNVAVSFAPQLSAHDLSVLVDFLLFGATLACVAIFHRHTFAAAVTGLCVIILKKLLGTGFVEGPGFAGLFAHFTHEWVLIANLFLLLVGFALLARHFEESRIPLWMPAALPDSWTGGFVLLALVFVVSAFLDNIAAALIGATVARHIYKGRVRIGYLAAIVAAANAGGAGSVIGDTTTTMMWIAGVSPLSVLHAYVAALCALLVSGIPASLTQQKHAPIVKDPPTGLHISWKYVAVVIVVLASAIAANVGAHLLDAPQVPAVRRDVQIRLEDGVFAAKPFELEGAERLDRLGPPGSRPAVHHPADLHGQRAGPRDDAPGADVLPAGPGHGDRIDADVRAEALIFDGDRRLSQPGRHPVQRHGEAPLLVPPDERKERFAGAVGDPRAGRPAFEPIDGERTRVPDYCHHAREEPGQDRAADRDPPQPSAPQRAGLARSSPQPDHGPTSTRPPPCREA